MRFQIVSRQISFPTMFSGSVWIISQTSLNTSEDSASTNSRCVPSLCSVGKPVRVRPVHHITAPVGMHLLVEKCAPRKKHIRIVHVVPRIGPSDDT